MSDDLERDDSWLDVLLFLLVLIGVLWHKRRQTQEDEE